MHEIEARRTLAATALHRWLRPVELAVHESPVGSAVIHLRLLAVPALVRPDGTLVALERKDAALLALLALDGPRRAPARRRCCGPMRNRRRRATACASACSGCGGRRSRRGRRSCGAGAGRGSRGTTSRPCTASSLQDPSAAAGELLGSLRLRGLCRTRGLGAQRARASPSAATRCGRRGRRPTKRRAGTSPER